MTNQLELVALSGRNYRKEPEAEMLLPQEYLEQMREDYNQMDYDLYFRNQ